MAQHAQGAHFTGGLIFGTTPNTNITEPILKQSLPKKQDMQMSERTTSKDELVAKRVREKLLRKQT